MHGYSFVVITYTFIADGFTRDLSPKYHLLYFKKNKDRSGFCLSAH